MDLSDYQARLVAQIINTGSSNGLYRANTVKLAGKGEPTQGGIGLARLALYFDERGKCSIGRSFDVAKPHLFDELVAALREVDVEALTAVLPPVDVPTDIAEEVASRKLSQFTLEAWTALERIDNLGLPVIFTVYVCGMDGARWIDVWTPSLTPFKEMWRMLVEIAYDEWPQS